MPLDLLELLGLSDDDFRRALSRDGVAPHEATRIKRNAALVLGNSGEATALPALRQALEDAEAVVREAAAWAIARIEERTRK